LKKNITVLIVDDHTLVRRGFRLIIEDEPGLTVVGEAADGRRALQLACELKPAVVVMDCALPEMSGLLAAGQIVRSCPGTAVLMCSMHSEESWAKRAAKAGARGYIPKSANDFELTTSIRRVAAGERVFEPHLTKHHERKSRKKCVLSARELEILQLIVDGKSNREIALHLGLSASTVAAHRTNIMRGLKIHKVAQLVGYAIRSGLASIS
jgi:DNA-binding NarL/FixJ family response regulator